MIVRLSASKEDVPFDFTVSADLLDLSTSDVLFLGDVKIKGTLKFIGDGYFAKGDIRVNKKFICDRCLRDVEMVANIAFEEKFANYETEDAAFFSGDEIDLTDAVRDTVLLNEPIGHLCKEDCKGLCKICGKDLNEGDCGCDRRIPDPRLSVLDNLKI